MRTTKTFLLAVAVCVASSNAYTVNRVLDSATILTSFATDAKDLADDIKEIVTTETKTVTDLINMVKNATKAVMDDQKASEKYVMNIVTRELRTFVDAARSFWKSLFGSVPSAGIITWPNSNNENITSAISQGFHGLLDNIKNLGKGNIPSVIVLGENTLVGASNNDSDPTETNVNEVPNLAIVRSIKLVPPLMDDLDLRKIEVTESNQSVNSASSEETSQSKEAADVDESSSSKN